MFNNDIINFLLKAIESNSDIIIKSSLVSLANIVQY